MPLPSRSRARLPWLVALALLGGLRSGTRGGDIGPNVPPARRSELVAEAAAQTSTAEQLWAYIQMWDAERWSGAAQADKTSSARPRSKKSPTWRELTDGATLADELDIRVCTGCREFLQDFPADPRGWDARLLLMAKHGWEPMSDGEIRALGEQIIAAPEAPAPIRNQASKVLLFQTSWNKPDEAEKVYSAFEKDYPDDALGADLVWRRLIYYSWAKPQELVPRLSALTASPNKATAEAAARELALRTKPLQFKFTATDGRMVDVEKLRGRVVLLYFWDAWPDREKNLLPQVLALRKKYGAAQFQILGISLDDERSAMRKAIKTQGMDWPNVNDTVPERGSAIARRFGNSSSQAAWLVDPTGVAHQLPSGADLDSEVAKWIASPGR
jgi:hypothetical protein